MYIYTYIHAYKSMYYYECVCVVLAQAYRNTCLGARERLKLLNAPRWFPNLTEVPITNTKKKSKKYTKYAMEGERRSLALICRCYCWPVPWRRAQVAAATLNYGMALQRFTLWKLCQAEITLTKKNAHKKWK